MKWLRNKKGRIATALAIMLVVSSLYLPASNAADAIDLTKECSLTLTVPSGSAYFQDPDYLNNDAKANIPVKLYRVASVSAERNFTTLDSKCGVDIEALANTEKADWVTAAQTAASYYKDKTADTTVTLIKGSGMASKLEAGMYLVLADPVLTAQYKYSFTPYFISLPNNYYYTSGLAKDDNWLYDASSDIKLGQEVRYGSLQITKTLESYNTSLGDVTFVFQIEGTKGELTYSNVVSLNFSAAGQKSVLVSDIPAGMEVTVKEVYDGASYKLDDNSASSVQRTIVADGDEGAPVTADFANTYSNETKKGYGIENQFSYDSTADKWNWNKQDPTSEETEVN